MRIGLLCVIACLCALPALAAVGHNASQVRSGTFGAGNFTFSDSVIVASDVVANRITGVGAVPSGAVMFFNLGSCPTGWSELTSARGRYIVGLPSGGTLAGTAGTALTNQENRPVGQHSHSISITSSAEGSHTHGISLTTGAEGSHYHGVDIWSGIENAEHTHRVPAKYNVDPSHYHAGMGGYAAEGPNNAGGDASPLYTGAELANHQHRVTGNTGAGTSHSHSVSGNTGAGTSHSHSVSGTSADSGSVAGTNAPYIQLLVCQKN